VVRPGPWLLGILVHVVVYDSEYVSLEHLLLSCYPPSVSVSVYLGEPIWRAWALVGSKFAPLC